MAEPKKTCFECGTPLGHKKVTEEVLAREVRDIEELRWTRKELWEGKLYRCPSCKKILGTSHATAEEKRTRK